MPEATLAAQIRDVDRVDVLIDLALHSAANALLAFARKPAPVQVTWLGYPSTSGMAAAMDFRLTDPYLDPPGSGVEANYAERSLRLPRTYWCYAPPPDAPDADAVAPPPPAGAAGYVTFGCLNQFSKVSSAARQAWARILADMPGSRLILHSLPGRHRVRVAEEFARAGVDPRRMEWVDKLPTRDYFATYHRIDVALDPFPFTGGTTTCDALWMGVPVVTLAGHRAVARAGLSILSNVGLPQLIARDVDEYVRIATDLAGDAERSAQLRATLRDRMRASPLMDAAQFARDFEEVIRTAWRRWCDGAR
jgi:predicted O-linked N-acetylglucosamine transferase (SPINDLY family)